MALTRAKINQLDTAIEWIVDPLILVNARSTLANTDIGFVFNRDSGTSSNVALYWNESTDKLTVAYTTDTGLPNSNISLTRYANVAADWYFGNLAGGTTNNIYVSANILPTGNAVYNFGSPTARWNVGYFSAGTIDLGGSQISVDPAEGFKFTVGGTGTPTYLASNGLVAGSSLSSLGQITGGSGLSVVGDVNAGANVLASQVSAGSVITTGVINAGGNVLARTGVFNLLQVNGNTSIGAVTTPGTGHSIIGNVVQSGAGTVYYNTPGNIMAATGRFGSVLSDGLINTSANIMAATGRFGTVLSDGFINTSANVSAALHTGGSVVVSGLINTAANILSSQLTVFGNATIGAISTAGAVHSVVGNVQQSGAGTVFFNTPGNIMAAIGRFGSISTDGYINTSANISAAQLNAGQINTSGNLLATAGVFNGLTVNGNESVTGYLNVTGNIIATAAELGSVESAGVVYANGSAATTSTTSGALRTSGGAGIAGNTVIGGILTVGQSAGINVAAFTNTSGWFAGSANSWVQFGIQNTNTDVGASTDLIAYAPNGDNTSGWIDLGITGQNFTNQGGQYAITGANDGYLFMSAPSGAGTGGNLFISTDSTGLYNDIVFSTGGFNQGQEQARFKAGIGLKLIQGTPSTNPSTGALQVVGGVGIGGNLNVQGDISLAGNIYLTGNAIQFNTNSLSISDSLIYLAADNTADVLDIGFVGSFTNPGYQHTGFARDATDGTWKLFANVIPEPTTTIDFTNAWYSNLRIGNLTAVSAGYSGNVTAAYLIGTLGTAAQPAITSVGTLTSLAVAETITATGNVTVGNLLVPTGSGRFNGQFNETTTTAGVYVGNASPSAPTPRVGFFNGVAAQNWQIDNNYGTFRWFTPGTVRMQLDPNGNLAVNGLTTINPGSTSTDSALVIAGSVTKGGAGYHDFLRVTNGGGGTNINKWFRVNDVGSLEIINSAYNAIPFALTDGGILTISGNINAGSLTISGAQHVLNGNVQINAIGGLQIPVGTTLQRPGSGIAGQIRFNTDTNGFEGYSNVWAAIGGGGGGSTPGGVTTTMQYNSGGALGGIATMNYIVANGAIIISTGTSSTSTATGALQLIGGMGITENINVGGYVKVTGAVNTSANVLASQVSAGSVVTTGVGNFGGNVLASAGVFNGLTVNGNTTIGAVTVAGGVHSVVGNVLQTGPGTVFFNTTGNISASEIKAPTIYSGNIGTVSGALYLQGTSTADVIIASNSELIIDSTTAATSTSTGAVRIRNGGLSLASGNIVVGDKVHISGNRPSTSTNSGALTINGGMGIDGAIYVGGTLNTAGIVPTTSNTYSVGSSTAWYSAFWGKAVNAAYADLAETYSSDRDYIPGTVLVFGGVKEVTISTESHDPAVAGVVSTNPAYHMNAQAEGVAVALQGRVPTKVKGPVRKGDRVVASSIQGAAERLDMTKYQPGCIIGKALEDITDDSIQTIEVVVGRL